MKTSVTIFEVKDDETAEQALRRMAEEAEDDDTRQSFTEAANFMKKQHAVFVKQMTEAGVPRRMAVRVAQAKSKEILEQMLEDTLREAFGAEEEDD